MGPHDQEYPARPRAAESALSLEFVLKRKLNAVGFAPLTILVLARAIEVFQADTHALDGKPDQIGGRVACRRVGIGRKRIGQVAVGFAVDVTKSSVLPMGSKSNMPSSRTKPYHLYLVLANRPGSRPERSWTGGLPG